MLTFPVLPLELIPMIMGHIENPKVLRDSLFSRQLKSSADRIICENLCLIVWDPSSRPALAVHGDPTNTEYLLAHRFRSVSRLAYTAEYFPRLLALTSIVTIRFSAANPFFLKALCRLTASSTGFFNPLNISIWDRSLTTILKRTPNARDISFDWFDTMPLMHAQEFLSML